MNPHKPKKIYKIPTDKLVVMVDVSLHEYNKLLKKLRDRKEEVSSLNDLDKQANLWKNRYAVSSAELKRRVNEQFNAIDSEPNVKE